MTSLLLALNLCSHSGPRLPSISCKTFGRVTAVTFPANTMTPGHFSGILERLWGLESVILVGAFQPGILYDFMIL